jgi:hypothetical protein
VVRIQVESSVSLVELQEEQSLAVAGTQEEQSRQALHNLPYLEAVSGEALQALVEEDLEPDPALAHPFGKLAVAEARIVAFR